MIQGLEGQLVSLRFCVEPGLLEDLLEALAQVGFPINPQLVHRAAQVAVEFPAYSGRLDEVRQALQAHGFDPANLEVHGMLESAAAAG